MRTGLVDDERDGQITSQHIEHVIVALCGQRIRPFVDSDPLRFGDSRAIRSTRHGLQVELHIVVIIVIIIKTLGPSVGASRSRSGQNFPPTTHCLTYGPNSASVLSHTLVPQFGTHCRRTFMRHQTLLSLQDSSKLIILAELLMSFNSCFTDSWNATAFMV